jgi:hypothetical protein
MQYTLWSRGRLLGETDLGFIFREHGFRCGWFHPTALGERLMPAATGVAPALRTVCMIGPDATARADLASAVDQENALALELHGPDGTVIATEDIAIIDTHYLLSLAESDLGDEALVSAEEEAEIEAFVEEWCAERDFASAEPVSDEESELPRYQIQISLVDPDSLP